MIPLFRCEFLSPCTLLSNIMLAKVLVKPITDPAPISMFMKLAVFSGSIFYEMALFSITEYIY